MNAQSIDYSLAVNGTVVNLGTANVIVSSKSGISPTGGLRLPVVATIGSLTGKMPGLYRDTITVTSTQ